MAQVYVNSKTILYISLYSTKKQATLDTRHRMKTNKRKSTTQKTTNNGLRGHLPKKSGLSHVLAKGKLFLFPTVHITFMIRSHHEYDQNHWGKCIHVYETKQYLHSHYQVIFFLIFFTQVLGLGLIIAGGLLREKSETVNDKILPLLNKIGIGPGFTLGDLLEALAIIVIIIGVVAFGISVTGAFGACCKNRPLLIIVSNQIINFTL